MMLGKRVTVVKAVLYCGKGNAQPCCQPHHVSCIPSPYNRIASKLWLNLSFCLSVVQLIGGITGAALARGINPTAFQHAQGGSNVLIGISGGAGVGIEILGAYIAT